MRAPHIFIVILLLASSSLSACWRHRPAPEHAAILTAPAQGSFDDTLLHAGERHFRHILPLTTGQGYATHPSLNLDGTQIAFEAIRDGLSCEQIFVMDADGYNARLISQGTGRATHPAFSPTGTQVAFESSFLTRPTCANEIAMGQEPMALYPDAHDLFLSHIDSAAARTLLDAPNFQGLVSFSPSGDRVALTMREEDTTAIYILTVEDGEMERMNLAIHAPAEASFDAQGKRLVLTGTPNPKKPFVRELFIWSFESNQLVQLTEDGVQHGEPIFHPEGSHILFSSNIDAVAHTPGRQIYMLETSGKQLTQLTFGPGMSSSPSLSGKGTRIAFSSTRTVTGQPGMTPGIFIADFLPRPAVSLRLRGQAEIEQATLKSRIVAMTAEAMQGREAGTPGEQVARDWLTSQFEFVGLKPLPSQNGSYTQPFTFERSVQRMELAEDGTEQLIQAKETLQSANVVGWLPAREDGSPTELVMIVGAHYDHAGSGNSTLSMRETDHGTLHPGADDNASGIAAMLELAEALATTPREHDVIFVAFGAEEYGMHGSTHFVASGAVAPERMIAMLNMDMVGRLGDQALTVRGTQSSPVLRDLVRRHHPLAGVDVNMTENLPKSTDYVPFFMAEVPVLGFHTGLHDDYHTPGDVEALIDYEGLSRITLLGYLLIRELTTSPRRPVFMNEGAGHLPQGHPPVVEQGRDYTSAPSFGSMPGRSPAGSPSGVYFRAVQPDSPADRAGLKGGDILTHIDGEPVETLPQFATTLTTHKPGDVIEVTYVRDGEVRHTKVTLGEPLGQ